MSDGWDQFGEDYDHPAFEGKPRTYLIASTPRSGSHLLGHLLFGTGALGSPLEYFHPAHARKWMALFGTENFWTMMASLHRRRTSPSGWFGIKAHWSHFAKIAGNAAALKTLNPQRYIRIRRSDRIAQAISGVIAQQTDAWISFHEAHGDPRYDFAMISRAIEVLDEQIRQWDEFFRSSGITPVDVEYEELVADPGAVVDRILTDFDVCRTQVSEPRWLPRRQASEVNLRWQERYMRDLEIRRLPR